MSDNKILVGDMSRKQCLEILKRLLEAMETFDGISPSPERINALKMAISSLETDEAYQLEYEQPEFCEDCISREAVEKITWEEPTYTDALNVLTEVRDKIRELPSVLPKAKWIPVTTRKPKLEERVLIFTDGGKIKIAYRDNIPWTENQYEYVVISMLGYKLSYEEDKVLAWMPLPKSYSEVEE